MRMRGTVILRPALRRSRDSICSLLVADEPRFAQALRYYRPFAAIPIIHASYAPALPARPRPADRLHGRLHARHPPGQPGRNGPAQTETALHAPTSGHPAHGHAPAPGAVPKEPEGLRRQRPTA